MAVAGCTAMDVISILQKKRQKVTSLEVRAEGRRREEQPRAYTSVTVTYVLHGPRVREEAVRRAIELSEERYCSAMASLSQNVDFETQFEIIRDT